MHRILIIAAVLATSIARAGEVTAFKTRLQKMEECERALGLHAFATLNTAEATITFAALLERIRAIAPSDTLVRVDPFGYVWDWTPLDDSIFLDISFIRDQREVAQAVMVSRGRHEADLLITSPERIDEIELEIKTILGNARVIIDPDVPRLRERERLSAGLIL